MCNSNNCAELQVFALITLIDGFQLLYNDFDVFIYIHVYISQA